MARKITVTKALCSLRGTGVTCWLADCSRRFHFQILPMWQDSLAGKRQSPTGISAPGRINYVGTIRAPKPKERYTKEDRMLRSIDVFEKLPFISQCGLWLFSYIESEDANLIWCLIQTSISSRNGIGFNFRDAAIYRIKTQKASWKDSYKQSLVDRRTQEECKLRAAWKKWQPILKSLLLSSKEKNPYLFKDYEKTYFFSDDSRMRRRL